MSEDVVNNPKHYNKQGIEVIEVIEAYTPDSPHLANVLKYVCRCEYKGKKLQDLKKASWYLDRAIVLLEAEEDCAEWEADPANEDWTGIDRAVSDWTIDDIEPSTGLTRDEVAEQFEDLLGGKWRTKSSGYTEREAEVFFEGYECRQQEFEEDTAIGKHAAMGAGPVPDKMYVIPSPDRIAGDNDAAKRAKDEYYNFDRYEIVGYCACCDAEIGATQPYVKSNYFDADLKFCKQKCVDSLRAWQKCWKPE